MDNFEKAYLEELLIVLEKYIYKLKNYENIHITVFNGESSFDILKYPQELNKEISQVLCDYFREKISEYRRELDSIEE